jgi:hypothetical protein
MISSTSSPTRYGVERDLRGGEQAACVRQHRLRFSS